MAFHGIGKLLRSAWQDLKHDLRTTRWLRGWAWTAGVIWFLGLIITLIFVSMLSMFTSDLNACQPDGEFRLYPEKYSMWSSSGFFQITLGGGTLTFPQAKVIDVVWDIGVGRGGQFLLALVSWREFARYLTICMEHEPITYQLFRTIFIENDASILSTFRTIRSFIWQRRLRSKVAMAFMTATMLFILAFPTLVSAMSGYDSNVASRIKDQEDNLIPFNKYSRVLYVVHDGSRINLTDNYWVTDGTNQDDPVLLDNATHCSHYGYWSSTTGCRLVRSISDYVTAYGLDGLYNDTTNFLNRTGYSSMRNVTLGGTALNISAYVSEDKKLGGQNSSGILPQTWVKDNKTYGFAYFNDEDRRSCQNIGNYQWGFSFLQLFICIILLFAWTIGIYIMWIYTHYTLALRKRLPEHIAGEHRAVLEVAAAMQTELQLHHVDPCLLLEKQLRDRINKGIRGGAVSYAYADSTPKFHSIRRSLKVWFSAEKWWFLAMFTVTVFCSTGWMIVSFQRVYSALWFWSWLFSVWFGQFWAFCIGKTAGSRLLIILFWACVGAIIVVSLAGTAEAQRRG